MISVENVSKSFKNFTMGKQNYTIPDGFIVGVTGPNGSGKSTLLKLMQGAMKMEGSITIDGLDVAKDTIKVRQLIGYVSGDRRFFMNYSALDNEKYFAGLYPNWDSELYRKVLGEYRVPMSSPLIVLSTGEYIRFQTAFAVATKPKVLLLDEPMASLDPVVRDDYIKSIQSIVAEYETTVLIATHLRGDLERIADYIIDVREGQMYERD